MAATKHIVDLPPCSGLDEILYASQTHLRLAAATKRVVSLYVEPCFEGFSEAGSSSGGGSSRYEPRPYRQCSAFITIKKRQNNNAAQVSSFQMLLVLNNIIDKSVH